MRKIKIIFASLFVLLPLVSVANADTGGKSNPNQTPSSTPIPLAPTGPSN